MKNTFVTERLKDLNAYRAALEQKRDQTQSKLNGVNADIRDLEALGNAEVRDLEALAKACLVETVRTSVADAG
jgi:hypothetical protein